MNHASFKSEALTCSLILKPISIRLGFLSTLIVKFYQKLDNLSKFGYDIPEFGKRTLVFIHLLLVFTTCDHLPDFSPHLPVIEKGIQILALSD